jgi:arginine exporter protein ArgO
MKIDMLVCILLVFVACVAFIGAYGEENEVLKEVLLIKGWLCLFYVRFISETNQRKENE